MYLKRPLPLLAVEGRPLSSGGPEALSRMFEARDPVYHAVADREVDNEGPIPFVAGKVARAFADAIEDRPEGADRI